MAHRGIGNGVVSKIKERLETLEAIFERASGFFVDGAHKDAGDGMIKVDARDELLLLTKRPYARVALMVRNKETLLGNGGVERVADFFAEVFDAHLGLFAVDALCHGVHSRQGGRMLQFFYLVGDTGDESPVCSR